MNELIPSEHDEQVSLMQWCRANDGKYPKLKRIFAIPNGGARHIAVATKLKSEGVRKGVLDICFPVPSMLYNGLFIEMKRRKGSCATPEQKAEIVGLLDDGYQAVVCRGWEDARDVLIDYLEAGAK